MPCEGFTPVEGVDPATYQGRWDGADFEREITRARTNEQNVPPPVVEPSVLQPDQPGQNGNGQVTALDGKVVITGHNAADIAAKIEELYAESPSFRAAADAAIAANGTVNINVTDGGAGNFVNGTSTVGTDQDEVWLNIGQEASDDMVTWLIAHELGGHSFSNLGDDQYMEAFTDKVVQEMGLKV
jgi:hypothetical protein